MANFKQNLKKLYLLVFILIVFAACGEDDGYHAYQVDNAYEGAEAPPLAVQLRAEVAPYLLADIDYLEQRLRVEVAALAGPVYRRMSVDIWQQLEHLRNSIINDTAWFGLHATNFEDMMAAGSEWLVGNLRNMNLRQLGTLHFQSHRQVQFMDFQAFRKSLRYAPPPTDDVPETIYRGIAGNVTAEILKDNEIAFVRIDGAGSNFFYDRQALLPFFEKIQNFNHLIIDIRGHTGGFTFHFREVAMRPLIGEPIYATGHQFFTAGGHATWLLENDVPFRWQMRANTFNVYNAQEFAYQRNMVYFNKEDLSSLSYVIEYTDQITPYRNGFPFEGKIWLLVDGRTGSAGERAVLDVMSTGFATVVGHPTMGVMPAENTWIQLANTMIQVAVDVGYFTDAYGRSLTKFGIAPHYEPPRPLSALDYVLYRIENYN